MKNIDQKKFIEVCKERLKKIEGIKPPEWSQFVKTGQNRKFPPKQSDWWYTRTASILRKIYLNGPVGVEKLRTYYGGKKDRGHKPERFRKSGGSIIRKGLKQLETAGLIEKSKNPKKKGRIVTDKGNKFITDIVREGKE